MVDSDHGMTNHFQLKTKKENSRINEKLRLNENVKECRTIYSHKTFLDCNYSQMKHLECLNRSKIH